MTTEYTLSYTGSQINEKLGKIDSLAEKSELPTKTSDLTNDSGFITEYTETDPTVPEWAKQPTKPSYTASEVGALPADTVIPTIPDNVSAFHNDAGYLTEHQDISGKLDASALPTAINTALAQAKASGEFDGKDGQDGYTPQKGVDYFDGQPGRDGADGKQGFAGKTPVKGVDFWTAADQEAIVQQVITALGTPVFGRVDADKNIILSSSTLADGTYKLWFENENGKLVELCTMDYDADAPNYTNQIPLSTGTDGSVFNSTGYQTASRISTSSGVANVSNANATYPSFTTGFIPVKKGDVIRLQNCWMDTKSYDDSTSPYGHRTWALLVAFYDGLNTTVKASRAWTDFPTHTDVITATIGSDGRITQFVVNVSNQYMRLNLASADPSEAILTINEEIV